MIVQCNLDAETRHALTSLAYNAWASAYDTVKAVQNEEDDGSTDWQGFHEERMKNARLAMIVADRVLKSIMPFSPLTLGH